MSTDEATDHSEERIQHVLEAGLQRVQTPEAARAVVARIERISAGQTEQERAEAASRATAAAPSQAASTAAAAATIEHAAAEQPSPEAALAEALTTTAAQAVAPTPAAETVLEAAQTAARPARGRQLLKQAVLRRMGPLQALDAEIYLAINEAPHPGWLDSLAWALAIVTIGGWIWPIGVLLAYLLRAPSSWRAVKCLLPSVVGATWIVEYPIKAYFRRRRPFVEIVRALVIGKKPGSWSFPSGHTASSFASAWVLSTIWPRQSPIFVSLASLVGLSRIYVGAHYPGDVLSGACFGVSLAELIRRLVARWA